MYTKPLFVCFMFYLARFDDLPQMKSSLAFLDRLLKRIHIRVALR